MQDERVDGEAVAGDHVLPIVAQERAPGARAALRHGRQLVLAEGAFDRGDGDPMAELAELALDLALAPVGVLAR